MRLLISYSPYFFAISSFDKIVQEQKKRITRMIGLAVLGEVLVVTGLCVGAYFLGKASR